MLRITTQPNYFTSYNEPRSVEWQTLIQWLATHQPFEDKNDAPMFCGADSHAGQPKKFPYCKDYYALVLDYDDGETITGFKIKYSHLEYFLYTSHSHLKDGKTHKFRVVLPLASPIARDDMAGRKKALFKLFPSTDISTFARFRFFSAPSAPQERMYLTETHYNQGSLLDIHPLEWEPIKKALSIEEMSKREIARDAANICPTSQSVVLRNLAAEWEPQITQEHSYMQMLQYAVRLAHAGLTPSEIEAILENTNFDNSKYADKITERAEAGYEWWECNIGEYRQDVLTDTDKMRSRMQERRKRRGY
ncbi:hypothetical protein NU768_000855 [Vibrio vulnificus]|nr:hypothetical protein [Vibrio vulnificus]